jgi:transposase
MRYELADYEWAAIKPMLLNKPRGVPRVNDRRVLNGIFWVLRSGAPWRDLPEAFGPYTTRYSRFVRWRRAGVWRRIIDTLAAAHDVAVEMIDTSIVRNCDDPICFSSYLYRGRNQVERFFNRIKPCRRVATRYAKLAANDLAFVKLASIRLWLAARQ